MLILTRNPKQKIIINEEIEIIILKTKGRQVRLGIIAPEEVAIKRLEIHDKQRKNSKLDSPKDSIG